VRLGACVAFELAIGVAVSAAVAIGVHRGLGEIRHWEREAQAATLTAGPSVAAYDPQATVGALLDPVTTVDRAPPRHPVEIFDGVRDELLLAPLRAGRITEVKFNRGGSSISLRVDFDNGARAAFKPEQINFQTIPRREVAAYRINRLLGMSSVAPAVGRSFDVEELLAAVRDDSREFVTRMRAEMLAEGGRITGELSFWIPVIRRARVDGFLIDETDGIVTWKRHLRVGNPIPPEDWRLMAQLSDMLVFDFVINNSDRWSGRNVQASADNQILYFMDNTLSFGPARDGHSKVRVYLERAQKFSRSLVARLRRLSADEVRAALDGHEGEFAYLLDEDEVDALLSRRDHVLAYIDQLIAQHGDQAVLVFP
jgi:hypothetical protein